eukprot:2080924-Lingulodinium_polyedra.AAC.1
MCRGGSGWPECGAGRASAGPRVHLVGGGGLARAGLPRYVGSVSSSAAGRRNCAWTLAPHHVCRGVN